MSEPRPTFILRMRPELHVADPVKALRQALKLLLRRCGLRCIEAREISDQSKGKTYEQDDDKMHELSAL